MRHIALSVFGPPVVRVDQQVVPIPVRKLLALLVYLIVERGPHERETLATLLWPGSNASQGRAALRVTLARLGTLLRSHALEGIHVHTTRDTITVEVVSNVYVDMHVVAAAFDALVAQPEQRPAPAMLATFETAVEAYKADFLAGFHVPDAPEFEQWSTIQQERWHLRMGRVFDRLTQAYLELGDAMQAGTVAQRWIQHDPLNEGAHRAYIHALVMRGERVAALRAYERCKTTLHLELDIAPEPATEALAALIRTTTGPQTLVSVQRSVEWDLPVVPPPRPLIGRETEVAAVVAQVVDPAIRLLTLVGAPGVGKTQLARAALGDARHAFADAVAWVDLTPIGDTADVVPAIAVALNITTTPDQSVHVTLLAALRPRRLLLVLDNCEHLLAMAPLLVTLLDTCPALTVLATSRAPLQLWWERRFVVKPLPIPDPTQLHDLKAVAATPAVQLFVQRAQAVNSFNLTSDNVVAVAELCIRLDGLPLAVEVAASHLAHLTPNVLLARLAQQLPLPAIALHDAPRRHNTVEAAIMTSYRLLDPALQAVFRRLSVFVGSFTIDAAAEVTASVADGGEGLNALLALANHHLIESLPSDTLPRFRMLETVRMVAWSQVERCHELMPTLERHADYYTRFAEHANEQIQGATQAAWLQQMQHEYDNVRAVMRRTSIPAITAMAARVSVALYRFWDVLGWWEEGRRWYAYVVAQDVSPTRLRACVLHAAGNLAIRQGNYTEARTLHEAALTIQRTAGDVADIARCVNSVGVTALAQGDMDGAALWLEESLALWRQLDKPAHIADTLNNLGVVALDRGNYDRAYALHTDALGIRRELANPVDIAQSLQNIGQTLVLHEQPMLALGAFEEVIAIMQREENLVWLVDTLEYVAWALTDLGFAPLALVVWHTIEPFRLQAPCWPTDQVTHDRYMAEAHAVVNNGGFDTGTTGRSLACLVADVQTTLVDIRRPASPPDAVTR